MCDIDCSKLSVVANLFCLAIEIEVRFFGNVAQPRQ